MKEEFIGCDCNTVHQNSVDIAKKGMLKDDDYNQISNIFKVLGDPTRMKIVWALKQTELCVCDLAVTLNMTKSAISHQLNTLKQERLVKGRREGKNIFYSLDDDHVTEIIEIVLIHYEELGSIRL